MTRDSAWWGDANVPDLSEPLAGLGLDEKAFAAWLAPWLEEYRNSVQSRAIVANPTQNLQRVARDAAKLAKLLAEISPRAEPFLISAPSVIDLQTLAVSATRAHDQLKGRSGRKPEGARNVLLDAVVEELSKSIPKRTAAHAIAEQILMLCRVPVPSTHSGGIGKATRTRKK